MSRPPRARGLKHIFGSYKENIYLSRPPRARGLKPKQQIDTRKTQQVAPPAGAWIETFIDRCGRCSIGCRAPRGRVD